MDVFDFVFAALLVALGAIGGFYFTRLARWVKTEYSWWKNEVVRLEKTVHYRADRLETRTIEEARDIRNTVHNRITQAEQKFEQIKKAL